MNKSLINIFLQFEYPEVKPTESKFLNSGGQYKHYYCSFNVSNPDITVETTALTFL